MVCYFSIFSYCKSACKQGDATFWFQARIFSRFQQLIHFTINHYFPGSIEWFARTWYLVIKAWLLNLAHFYGDFGFPADCLTGGEVGREMSFLFPFCRVNGQKMLDFEIRKGDITSDINYRVQKRHSKGSSLILPARKCTANLKVCIFWPVISSSMVEGSNSSSLTTIDFPPTESLPPKPNRHQVWQ